MRQAVFLDRDGVLTAPVPTPTGSRPPWSLDEMRLLPGVTEACQRLHRANWVLVVATNQPDVARGQAQRAAIDAIHAQLLRQLPLDDIRVCFHDDADHCACRKPRPGLLLDAARSLQLELAASWMVGDRPKDIAAGVAAGCRSLWLHPEGDCANLTQAATIILQSPRGPAPHAR